MSILLWNMRKFHFLEYKVIRFSVFYFVTFEIFGELSPEFGNFINNVKTIRYNYWVEMIMQTGFYPVFQAIGIIYLKRTRDPLEGISKLDCLQIVSINQRLTKKFVPNLRSS